MPKINSSAARPPVSVAILARASSLVISLRSCFIHLHGIAQSAGSAGHDGDLVHRGGMSFCLAATRAWPISW